MRRAAVAILAVLVLALLVGGFLTATRLGTPGRTGLDALGPSPDSTPSPEITPSPQNSPPPTTTSSPSPAVSPSPTPAPSPAADPVPDGYCPPVPEDSSQTGSNLILTGACAFRQHGPVICDSSGDDFYADVQRQIPTPPVRMMHVYVNVEAYHGPGAYKTGEILLLINGDDDLYQWSAFDGRVTVAKGGLSLDIATTRLTTQPGQPEFAPVTISGHLACR